MASKHPARMWRPPGTRRPLRLATAAGLVVALALASAGNAAARQAPSDTTSAAVYLVRLADPPVASYTGGSGHRGHQAGPRHANSTGVAELPGVPRAPEGGPSRRAAHAGVDAGKMLAEYGTAFNGFAAG